MRTLRKLKINQLGKNELEKRQMNSLIGGNCCGCGCNGPSGTWDNANANWNNGHSQSQGGNRYCASWGDTSWGATC